MNIFRIEHLQVEDYDNSGYAVTMQYIAEIKGYIDILCNEHGHKQATLHLAARAKHPVYTESMRKAIEDLLNHRYEHKFQIHQPKCNCSFHKSDKVQFDFSDLSEPWRSMFTDIFNERIYTMPQIASGMFLK